jgi:hypothetical protein
VQYLNAPASFEVLFDLLSGKVGFAVFWWVPDAVVHGYILVAFTTPMPLVMSCLEPAYCQFTSSVLPLDDHVVKDEDTGLTGNFMFSSSPQIFWLHFLVSQPPGDTVVGQCKSCRSNFAQAQGRISFCSDIKE